MQTTTMIDELRYLMRKTPFEPFRFHCQDGTSYLVPRVGWLLIADDWVEVGVAKSRRAEIPDRAVRIPASELTGAEIVKRSKRR
jgi:hypothetical protein